MKTLSDKNDTPKEQELEEIQYTLECFSDLSEFGKKLIVEQYKVEDK